MGEIEEQIEGARAAIRTPEWDAVRQTAAMAKTRRRLRRQRQVLPALVAAAVLLVGFGTGWFALSGTKDGELATEGRNEKVPETDSVGTEVRLADGSRAVPLRTDTILTLETDRSVESRILLGSGSARFDVETNPDRRFIVQAGDVSVEALGTVFEVARWTPGSDAVPEGRVRVKVSEGRVRVRWPRGEAELPAGEESLFPPENDQGAGESTNERTEADNVGRDAPPHEPSGTAPREASPDHGPDHGWRALARAGEFDRAHHALTAAGAQAVRDRPAELLLAADVARLSGHPGEAVSPLRRVLSAHASDARAPLAAFTLGRIYLTDLGRPGEAARSFARARRMQPGGSLAESALAREVEAWSRSGQSELARDRAEEYVARYPSGARVRLVRRLGGLE